MNEKYQTYLASREWSLLREAVRSRAGNCCERCALVGRRSKLASVHHRTYARIYREELTDLIGLCDDCHEFIHAKGKNNSLTGACQSCAGDIILPRLTRNLTLCDDCEDSFDKCDRDAVRLGLAFNIS